jgi:oligopeptidase B
MKCPVKNPGIQNWTEVIAHRSDVLLEDIEFFNKYLVIAERKEGLVKLRLIDWKTNNEKYVDFGEATYTAELGQNPDFDSDLLRYNYTSLTTPNSVIDYNLNTGEKTLKKQQEIIGHFEPTDYFAERLQIKARDGKTVPVSLVYKKSLKGKQGNPLLLYGYGSYGHSSDAYFSPARLSLLDRGFIFAIAHIRGGQEMGREWYEDGKLLNKMNTFNDFIDCAQYLTNNNFSTPQQMFAMGGSAGGLLVGAVANMRPDLFKGIIAAVPFVDVVTTMLDESIPLTTGEYEEWGNPNNLEYYNYMLSYSPYDNVTPQAYPAMLVTTGLHDSQVQYWEPAKWVARLRATKTDNNLLLLKTDMDTGHGGASGRFEAYRDNALQYAFMLKLLGITK